MVSNGQGADVYKRQGELTEFNGRLYCPDCLDDLTLVCTDCGSRFPRTHNRSENDDFPICPECYERDYTRCVRCGRIIDTDHCWYPLDNDDPYCADCCSAIENSPIHAYYFKPYPIFYGDGPRYFGCLLYTSHCPNARHDASVRLP